MELDLGLAVVVVATLIFYLRLIILQKEKAKRAARAFAEAQQSFSNQKMKNARVSPIPKSDFSILSLRRADWIIAGLGLLAILVGVLLNRGVLSMTSIQPYWWLPTSAGIIAFSWLFRL